MIEFLAGALEWVKGYGEGIGSLVTAAALVVGGFWAIYEYNTAKKYESAKWLHDVFHSFYLDPRFDKLRICLEFDYTNKLAPLIERVLIDENAEVTETDKLLLCDLDTTLNYLEFILHLEKTKHLSESDRKAIFAFWYELICRPDYAALRMYVRQCGYEAISSAIVMLSGTGKSRANCIAFYGTLVGGHGTQEDLGVKEKLRHLGSCIINGELRDLGEFPGLVTGDQMIRGELYEVADLAAFKILDKYEEFDPSHFESSMFVRRAVRLKEPDIDCWAYFYNRDASHGRKIDDLQWREYKRRRDAGDQTL